MRAIIQIAVNTSCLCVSFLLDIHQFSQDFAMLFRSWLLVYHTAHLFWI